MIQKAIEKIDEEIKSFEKDKRGMLGRELGRYVKSELLTSDSNALKILASNTDLETFTERIEEIALSMRSFKSEDITKAGKEAIATIKGIKPEDVTETQGDIETIGKLYAETAEGKQDNGVCVTSELCLPLLQIYYGIPLEPAAEKESAPKRRRFNTVSLD